jgi:hypothetical protein
MKSWLTGFAIMGERTRLLRLGLPWFSDNAFFRAFGSALLLPESTDRSSLWDMNQAVGRYWLEQGDNWLFNIDLDYFFCDMDSGDCRRFLDSAYVKDMCASIKNHLGSGRIKVLTICLTPDENGFSGGWASSEALCSEICGHLGIEFSLP